MFRIVGIVLTAIGGAGMAGGAGVTVFGCTSGYGGELVAPAGM